MSLTVVWESSLFSFSPNIFDSDLTKNSVIGIPVLPELRRHFIVKHKHSRPHKGLDKDDCFD